jgi:2-phospho-L-lactate guanylyltransferase
MRVIVPYAVESPKTRLGSILTPAERDSFARVMLEDVLESLRTAGHEPGVLTTASMEIDAPVTVDARPLTPAVNAILDAGDPLGVVMADLPLATPGALDRLFDAPGEVVLAPGRAGGTNAFVARHQEFRVDYHGTSFLDHLSIAHEIGASVSVIDSHQLSTDIDEPADLVEVLVHGEGASAEWLREAGFRLDRSGDRVTVVRENGE